MFQLLIISSLCIVQSFAFGGLNQPCATSVECIGGTICEARVCQCPPVYIAASFGCVQAPSALRPAFPAPVFQSPFVAPVATQQFFPTGFVFNNGLGHPLKPFEHLFGKLGENGGHNPMEELFKKFGKLGEHGGHNPMEELFKKFGKMGEHGGHNPMEELFKKFGKLGEHGGHNPMEELFKKFGKMGEHGGQNPMEELFKKFGKMGEQGDNAQKPWEEMFKKVAEHIGKNPKPFEEMLKKIAEHSGQNNHDDFFSKIAEFFKGGKPEKPGLPEKPEVQTLWSLIKSQALPQQATLATALQGYNVYFAFPGASCLQNKVCVGNSFCNAGSCVCPVSYSLSGRLCILSGSVPLGPVHTHTENNGNETSSEVDKDSKEAENATTPEPVAVPVPPVLPETLAEKTKLPDPSFEANPSKLVELKTAQFNFLPIVAAPVVQQVAVPVAAPVLNPFSPAFPLVKPAPLPVLNSAPLPAFNYYEQPARMYFAKGPENAQLQFFAKPNVFSPVPTPIVESSFNPYFKFTSFFNRFPSFPLQQKRN